MNKNKKKYSEIVGETIIRLGSKILRPNDKCLLFQKLIYMDVTEFVWADDMWFSILDFELFII